MSGLFERFMVGEQGEWFTLNGKNFDSRSVEEQRLIRCMRNRRTPLEAPLRQCQKYTVYQFLLDGLKHLDGFWISYNLLQLLSW